MGSRKVPLHASAFKGSTTDLMLEFDKACRKNGWTGREIDAVFIKFKQEEDQRFKEMIQSHCI